MIDIRLQILNPFRFWLKERKPQNDFIYVEKLITENKFVEFQVSRTSPWSIFQFNLCTEVKGQDHAGPSIDIDIFGFFVVLALRDKRHWDYDNNCWETHPFGM